MLPHRLSRLGSAWWVALLMRRSREELRGRLSLAVAAVALGTTCVTTAFVLRDSASARASRPGGDEAAVMADGLASFGSLAMFVAAFVIQNTLTMLVQQRAGQLGTLRALGADRKQVRRLVLADALGIGMGGAVVGLCAGLVVAAVLAPTLPAGTSLTVDPGSLVGAAATGTAVTVLAAWLPSRWAARVPPISAMRSATVDQHAFTVRRAVVGVALLLVTVGGYGFALATSDIVGLVVAAACLMVALTAFAVLGPAITPHLVRGLSWPLVRWAGPVGRLAADNAVRNPRRVAAVSSALALPVALLASTAVTATSSASGRVLPIVLASFGLAAIVASLGVFTALLLSTRERSREFAVLRVVGASTRQAKAIVRWECALVVAVGAVAGLTVGVVNGVVVGAASGAVSSVSVPVVALAVILGLAAVVGLAVSVVPARFVARLDVLSSLRPV
ncbi:MAG: FtsX-like permease family protein [Phycicoccus sp.]